MTWSERMAALQWESARQCRHFLRLYGPASYPLLIALAFGISAVFTSAWVARQKELRLTPVVDRSPTFPGVPPADLQVESVRRDLDQFHQMLPAYEQLPSLIADMADVTGKLGLNWARGEYAIELDTPSQLARCRVIMPIKGPGHTVMTAMENILARHPSVALTGMALKREMPLAAEVEGRLEFVVYMRLPAARNQP